MEQSKSGRRTTLGVNVSGDSGEADWRSVPALLRDSLCLTGCRTPAAGGAPPSLISSQLPQGRPGELLTASCPPPTPFLGGPPGLVLSHRVSQNYVNAYKTSTCEVQSVESCSKKPRLGPAKQLQNKSGLCTSQILRRGTWTRAPRNPQPLSILHHKSPQSQSRTPSCEGQEGKRAEKARSLSS